MIKELAYNYKKSTDELLDLVNSLGKDQLDENVGDGWTPRQVIHHLADSEAQSYARLRRLIAEPGSIIQGYDENIWAANTTLGYHSEDITSAVAVFTAVREASYRLLLRLDESHLDNSGTHTESGPYSVRNWLKSYTNHPLDHAHQIRIALKQ